ncbi:hypothetical protein PFLmoz3_01938 [Pseudomonas fluorescens]|uniref:Uncharacterized protein n=1 Tax=Pseudomonas fluorescens TaxID=294 RepID=A0A120G8L4_PSEFL|nr:hypothetical protein PFLmoz3_01938 [Pseudomonas fluorescens]
MLFEDFQPQRALPGDDGRVIKRRQQCRALLVGDPFGFTLGVVLGLADDAYLGAQIANGLNLVRWHQMRQANRRLHALSGSGIRQSTTVIAGRRRHHATRFLLGAQLRHGIARAAQFETAGDLLGFEFEVHRHAQSLREAGRIFHGGTPDKQFDALASEVNIM